METDNIQISAVCLLDLTAAFDTVDHDLLLQTRARFRYQRTGVILVQIIPDWQNLLCSIRWNDVNYDNRHVLCSAGISTNSPAFHFIYCRTLGTSSQERGTLNPFADDTQLYLHCNSNSTASATSTSELCIAEVSRWMSANRLKLNEDKTEFIWTGSDNNIRKLSGNGPMLTHGTDIINASTDACFSEWRLRPILIIIMQPIYIAPLIPGWQWTSHHHPVNRGALHLIMMSRECSWLDPSYQRHITFVCKGCYQLHPHHRLGIITLDLLPVPIYQPRKDG